MDLSSQLMNQIRMQNAPQAQLIQQTNDEADLLQHMPTQNPMGPAMMKFGLGILGAPPEMSTSQAAGLSGQEAMKTYEEHAQKQNQNRMQSIALRQTAANTIDAVRKFNMENEFKNRQMSNLEAQTAEMKRHNLSGEETAIKKMMADSRVKNIDRHSGEWNEEAKDYRNLLSKINEAKNAQDQLKAGVSPGAVNQSVSDENKVEKTWFQKNALNQIDRKHASDIIVANEKAIKLALRPNLEDDPNGIVKANQMIDAVRPFLTELYHSGADPKLIQQESVAAFSRPGATPERVTRYLNEYFKENLEKKK